MAYGNTACPANKVYESSPTMKTTHYFSNYSTVQAVCRQPMTTHSHFNHFSRQYPCTSRQQEPNLFGPAQHHTYWHHCLPHCLLTSASEQSQSYISCLISCHLPLTLEMPIKGKMLLLQINQPKIK